MSLQMFTVRVCVSGVDEWGGVRHAEEGFRFLIMHQFF